MPARRWLWILALSVLAAALAIGSTEWVARAQGWRASYSNSPRLFSYWRGRALEPGDTLVIVGSSKSQLGLSAGVLSERLAGRTVVHLGVNGGRALEVFEHLAADPAFAGTVLYEVTPSLEFSVLTPKRASALRAMLDGYDHRSAVDAPETALRLFFEARLVTLRPDFQPQNFARSAATARGFPPPSYYRVLRDRTVEADSTMPRLLTDVSEAEVSLDHDGFERQRARLEAAAQQLEARGGRLVFLRLPSSGSVLRSERERWPRALWFDEYGGDRARLHFEDGDRDWPCPDETHLDVESARRFTRWVASEL